MYYLLLFVLFLTGCSSQEAKVRKKNLKGEYIYRFHDEYFFIPPPPLLQTPPTYPWESRYSGTLPKITKEFFRCKGNALHPVILQVREGKEPIMHIDCNGGKNHGLPLHEGKEFIYPCLIDLLNYIQDKMEKRVIITCGHRCPKHNAYTDYSSYNWGSKHMLGAEVDFYVEGMENDPLSIVTLIQKYYSETFSERTEYTQFQRLEQSNLNVSTPPWYNKEILIKLYLKEEGRDGDNQHPFPYIGVQVRTDRVSNAKVIFDDKQAQNYLRH